MKLEFKLIILTLVICAIEFSKFLIIDLSVQARDNPCIYLLPSSRDKQFNQAILLLSTEELTFILCPALSLFKTLRSFSSIDNRIQKQNKKFNAGAKDKL